MPLKEVEKGKIKKYEKPTNKLKKGCVELIQELDYTDLWRGQGVLHKSTVGRLDMQSRTKDNSANLAVQLNKGVSASAFVEHTALVGSTPAMKTQICNAVQAILIKSLNSGLIYRLEGSLP